MVCQAIAEAGASVCAATRPNRVNILTKRRTRSAVAVLSLAWLPARGTIGRMQDAGITKAAHISSLVNVTALAFPAAYFET
jgi:hypothetical protein